MSKWHVFAWTLSSALAIHAFLQVSRGLDQPYMDEIFHIPQTVKYCEKLWKSWDPKITTPPGLYVLGFGYSQAVSAIFPSIDFCSLNQLRSLNLIGVTVVLPLLCHLLHVDCTISAMPLIAFYSTLYYTDVWSTVFVIAAFLLARHEYAFLSALSGFISLWFRQTNIVWTALIGFSMLTNGTILGTLKNIYRRPAVTVSFGAVGLIFLAFLKLNGGITLGDKSNHEISLNFPQLFHFILFYLFFSWPLWLSQKHVCEYLRTWFTTGRALAVYSISVGIIGYLTYSYTKPHAFILADNRHYTFYLWRRIIDPSWSEYAKLLPVPVYHFGLWTFQQSFNQRDELDSSAESGVKDNRNARDKTTDSQRQASHVSHLYNRLPLFKLAFFFSIIITLVPGPLLEPRYYIFPYVFWRLFYKPTRFRAQIEWIWYMIINLVTYWIFLNKPFFDSDGNLSRFMW